MQVEARRFFIQITDIVQSLILLAQTFILLCLASDP
jgi:hypothetical protein